MSKSRARAEAFFTPRGTMERMARRRHITLAVGDKVKFKSEKRPYTVQAADDRFAVCTKPFNLQRTVLYTVIDFKERVRGTENLVFGFGAETREQCEDMLDRLNGRPDSGYRSIMASGDADCMAAIGDPTHTEVSHRNRIPLDIETVNGAAI